MVRYGPEAILQMLRLSFRGQFVDPALAMELDFHIPDGSRERGRQFGFLMGDLVSFDLREDSGGVEVPALRAFLER